MNLTSKNQTYILSIVLSLFFFFYVTISSSYAGMEDAATFILMANNWGLSHPPGYPLFSILGNLFSMIPFSSFLFRIHLLNIVLGVSSIYLLFRICIYFTKNFFASLVAVLVFGFTQTFVFQTVSAEVYALYLFLSLFLILWIQEYRSHKYFYFGLGVLIGLSLANHWPLFLLGFSIYLYLYLNFETDSMIEKKQEKKSKANLKKSKFINPTIERLQLIFLNKFIYMGLLFGLSPYLHLILSRFYTNYFFYFKIDSFSDFISYVLRREQSTTDILETWRFIDSYYFFKSLLISIYTEFGFTFLGLGFFGFVFSFFKRRKIFYFLLLLIFSTPILLLLVWRTEFNSFTEELFRNWMLISFAGFSISLSISLDFFLKFDFGRFVRFFRDKNYSCSFVLGLVFLFLGFLFYENLSVYKKQKNDSFTFQYADVILSSLPKDSVLLVNTDEDSGAQIFIAQKYFGLRKDILITSALGAVFPEKIFERNKDDLNTRRIKLLNFISSHSAKNRKVFTTKKFGLFDEKIKFPMEYSVFGPLFLVSESKEISESDLVFSKESLDKSKIFLDGILEKGYDSHWIRYRRAAIGNICHILLVNKIDHPIFYKEESCIRLAAQYNHSILKNYSISDQLYLSLIQSKTNDSYISEKVNIAREFLINRISIFNSSKKKPIMILQEAIDLVFPITNLYPVCKNPLAKSILEVSKQLPIYIDKFEFYKNFGDCKF